MSEIGKRIAGARAAKGMNQSELARALGVSPQAVQKWEAGGTPKGARLGEVAQVLGTSIEFLLGGSQSGASRPVDGSNVGSSPRSVISWEHESELPEDQYVFIPRLTVEASCGDGRVAWHVEEKGQRNAFRRSWADRLGINPEKCATIVASGDSMEERICDGDSLVVDHTQTNISDGKIYVIAYENEVFVKRLFKRLGGGIRIVSDNTDKIRYPDWDVAPEQLEHLQIIGRVVAISGGV